MPSDPKVIIICIVLDVGAKVFLDLDYVIRNYFHDDETWASFFIEHIMVANVLSKAGEDMNGTGMYNDWNGPEWKL